MVQNLTFSTWGTNYWKLAIITSHGKPHNYKMQCLLVLIPVHIVIWANIMTQVGNLYWHEAQHLLLVLRTFLVGQYCKLDAPVDELQLSQFLQILKSVVLFKRNSSSCWWLWSATQLHLEFRVLVRYNLDQNNLIHETSSQLNVLVTQGLNNTNPAVAISYLKASWNTKARHINSTLQNQIITSIESSYLHFTSFSPYTSIQSTRSLKENSYMNGALGSW